MAILRKWVIDKLRSSIWLTAGRAAERLKVLGHYILKALELCGIECCTFFRDDVYLSREIGAAPRRAVGFVQLRSKNSCTRWGLNGSMSCINLASTTGSAYSAPVEHRKSRSTISQRTSPSRQVVLVVSRACFRNGFALLAVNPVSYRCKRLTNHLSVSGSNTVIAVETLRGCGKRPLMCSWRNCCVARRSHFSAGYLLTSAACWPNAAHLGLSNNHIL